MTRPGGGGLNIQVLGPPLPDSFAQLDSSAEPQSTEIHLTHASQSLQEWCKASTILDAPER